MILDGLGAEEQCGCGLACRSSLCEQQADLQLLWCEGGDRARARGGHVLARGGQLGRGVVAPHGCSQLREHLVRGPQLHSRVDPPAGATQALTVREAGAGDLETVEGLFVPRERRCEPCDEIVLAGGEAARSIRPRLGPRLSLARGALTELRGEHRGILSTTEP